MWPDIVLSIIKKRGLIHIKDEVLANGSFDIKDGTNTRLWDDIWVGDKPLKVKYPSLYNIVRDLWQNLLN